MSAVRECTQFLVDVASRDGGTNSSAVTGHTAMNLHDHILAALRRGQLDFAELRKAVNDAGDPRHPWSEEWFAGQLKLLEWRGQIEKRGTSYRVVKSKTEAA